MRSSAFGGVEIGLVALLASAVLAFGSVAYWSRTLFIVGAAGLFLAWWIGETRGDVPRAFLPGGYDEGVRLGGVTLARSGFGLPAGLFLLAVGVQLVPLPEAVRALLAPAQTARQVDPHVVLGLPGGAGSGWRALSVAPGDTLNSLLLLAAYIALFVVTYHVVRSREILVGLCRGLVAVGFGVALVALAQDLSGTDKIYGLKVLRYGGSPYGPFVNHNHFAGYVEMMIPLAFALLLRRLRRGSSGGGVGSAGLPSGPGSAARRMLEDDRLLGERSGQAILLGLGLTVMLAALFLCLSRGGLLALAVASALVLAVLAVGGHLRRWEVAALVVVAVCGLGLFLWVGPGEALDHFREVETLQNEPSLALRPAVWRATLEMFRDSPVLGTGLGTFPLAFLHHYPAGTQQAWYQAHNDYLQLLAETGVVGGLIGLLALGLLLARLLGPLAGRGPLRERYILCGLVAGIVSLLLHSLVDFNLQVPANAGHFVVLCAMALAHRRLFQSRKEV